LILLIEMLSGKVQRMVETGVPGGKPPSGVKWWTRKNGPISSSHPQRIFFGGKMNGVWCLRDVQMRPDVGMLTVPRKRDSGDGSRST